MPRISSPYPHRSRWRCRVTTEPGSHTWAPAGDTPEEARELAEELVRAYEGQIALTVGGLVTAHCQWIADRGAKPISVKSARVHLLAMLGGVLELEIASITPARAQALYAEAAGRFAAATHRAMLLRCRSAWKWAIRGKIARANPWADVEATGRPKRGKPQLRIDEARKLSAACMAEVMTEDRALGVLMAQLMALRYSEIAKRVVRDVDNGGTLLWVEDAKTPSGRRAPQIPLALQPAIAARCAGRSAAALLLRGPSGGRMDRSSMTRWLERTSLAIGIPTVCLHALRGQWATIAVESGALTHAVAAALGHSSFAMTEKHYAAPGSVQQAQQDRRLELLGESPAVPAMSPPQSPPPLRRR